MEIPSRIKDVYIELPDYSFHHGNTENSRKSLFVGRKNIQDRLKMLLLESSKNPSGAYLIAGYRGMGKTTLIDHVISEINPTKKESIKILEKLDVSLSQDNIKDQDVLRLMARKLFRNWLDFIREYMYPQNNGSVSQEVQEITSQLKILVESVDHSIKVNDKTRTSNKRLPDKYEYDKILTRLAFQPKEIEKELIVILDRIQKLRHENGVNIPYFVFIIDELDKIEPHYLYERSKNADDDDDIFGMNKVRRRQEEVERLLANLKSFLNTAKAKFIFIGGREMYDAALADISDRESFFSSVFHDIIYVPSFFKDTVSRQSGLTRLTEAYLAKLIVPESYLTSLGVEINDDWFELKNLFKYFKSIKNKKESDVSTHLEVYKVILLLQNFILYLTYRSNGTPKKLVSLIESYVWPMTEVKIAEMQASQEVIVFAGANINNDTSKGNRKFLRFSYNQQYEIGLTSNLYRPYAIIHSRTLKTLGDKLLYSTAYIIDYLLKFHPHAFSWRNLEMMPEIILINRDPNLRYYLEDVLKFLTGMYIRDTVNSIFQHKFYDRAASEIKLLAKISEPASAAFNFTLDESLQVKSYYRKKLKQLQHTYPNHTKEFIHSVSFMQSMLADLHYFDKEYDEAIVYHADAIQVLRKKVQNNPKSLTKHQVVLYVRHKLLLGLCLEKIKAFDSAYSIYRGLILNTPNLLDRVTNNDELYASGSEDVMQHRSGSEWDKPIRRMQLFIRPHIALLDIIEKQRVDGITYANLLRNFKDVYDFLIERKGERKDITIGYSIGRKSGKKDIKRDATRSHTLLADYYNHVGMILYYKNRNFRELFPLLKQLGYKNANKQSIYDFLESKRDHLKQGENFPDIENDKTDVTDHYVPSLSAMTYYLLALREIMTPLYKEINSLRKAIKNISSKSIFNGFNDQHENDFSKALILLSPEADGIVNAAVFFSIGNVFSKMGDALLGSLPNVKTNPNCFDISPNTLALFGKTPNVFLQDLELNKNTADTNELMDRSVGKDVLANLRKCMLTKNSIDDFLSLDYILILYRSASYFFLKSGRNNSCAFQYKKFLYVIKDYISFCSVKKDNMSVFNKELGSCCERVAERIFLINTWIADVSNRPQILKYRDIFQKTEQEVPVNNKNAKETQLIYLNLSTSPEVRETIALVEEIKLKLVDKTQKGRNENSSKRNYSIVTPYDMLSSKFARINELRAQCTLNYLKLKSMGFQWLTRPLLTNLSSIDKLNQRKAIFEKVKNSISSFNAGENLQQSLGSEIKITIHYKDKEKKRADQRRIKVIESVISQMAKDYVDSGLTSVDEFFAELAFDNSRKAIKARTGELLEVQKCICDSIFCLLEIIRNLNLFGISYIANHSYLANAHFKLANWCQAYLTYHVLIDEPSEIKDGIKSKLKKILAKEELSTLEPNYHNELAIQHYYAAIQTHNGGKNYRNINHTMSFLEDHFNDELTHFCAATERFRINIGFVRKKIKELKNKISDSKIYHYENYLFDNISDIEGD